ncbi:nitrite reductase [Desulfofustis limnaeus]|uniref:Nitrite reductase n=1 Tax=Desulfofustis limnaeus TaxID=2740163 RepID=A0ABM7W5U2_9BACT|nr:nitrite reductase [Desulfofustis limnaeus]MDX9895442.1 nitrite reductase [Desulfofustis sp.]BDD86204.1 hypothetical protein DPPLL_05690 [Desulfofustis limnaeus]
MAKEKLTILLPTGHLPLGLMEAARQLAAVHSLRVYLTNRQNLRLIDIPGHAYEEVRQELAKAGARFQEPGLFPLPTVCVGKPDCRHGLFDTEAVSTEIMRQFDGCFPSGSRLKIAVSGCCRCCSGAKLADIGVMGTRDGCDVFAGGKGGAAPIVGCRVARGVALGEVIRIIEDLVAFHQHKGVPGQRIAELMDDPEFPLSAC